MYEWADRQAMWGYTYTSQEKYKASAGRRRISVLRHFAQQHISMEPISLVLAVQVTDGAIMRKSFLGNSWAPIHSPLNATAYLSVAFLFGHNWQSSDGLHQSDKNRSNLKW